MDGSSSSKNPDAADQTESSADTRRRLVFRLLGTFFLIAAAVLAIFGTVALVAWEQGQTLRQENARQALEDEVESQLNLAEADMAAGSLNLAARRLEWVLARAPQHERAQSLQQELDELIGRRLTPTVTRAPTSTPSTTTAESEESAAALAEFSSLEALIAEQNWAQAVTVIPAFQARFPNFRRSQTDGMLYEAYIQRGVELINGSQVELGLFYLDQAERLGDLPQEVADQRVWAELYLLGVGTYQVDWAAAVDYFRDLCAAAPFYQDSCGWLYDSLTAYGDQFVAAGEFCPAERLYREAWNLGGDGTLSDKLQEASQGCQEATPTPEPITPEAELTPTESSPYP
ncbi:MAG: hypothetical protein R3300_06335 [Candidatus Promineifilaceae bacterium]|nr:hypothetical protein [Candidatus Promineifilaceae bacterium]